MILRDWLKKEGINGDTFAKVSGIPRSTVYRALRFPWKGLHTSTARRIIEVTRGKVTLEDLSPVEGYPRTPASRAAGGEE